MPVSVSVDTAANKWLLGMCVELALGSLLFCPLFVHFVLVNLAFFCLLCL